MGTDVRAQANDNQGASLEMAQYASPSKITYITPTRTSNRHLTVHRPATRSYGNAGWNRRGGLSATSVRTVRRCPAAPDKAVYRRRRLLAAGLALLAIAAVAILAQLIQAGIGGGPLTTTGAAASSTGSAMIPAGTTEYVVQQGDTLWSIAARIDAKGDERPLVDALSRELKGQTVYPGERLPIPSHW